MIKHEIRDGIGYITISRPDVHNAINQEMMEQLHDLLTQWKDEKTIKLLLVTGEGERFFCSGGDVREFHSLEHSGIEQMLHRMKSVLYKIQTFPKPTLAVLNGTALGGGCELAAACDFRIAHPEVEVGFIQITLGINTGWGGANYLFQGMSRPKALEWLLTGKKYSAKEALRDGFIHHLFTKEKLMDEAVEWCQPIVSHSVSSLESYKATALDQTHSLLSMEERLDREVQRSASLWGSDEHKKVVESFLHRNKKK